MESVDDLIEEAKLRTVGWALCVFAISYFLTRESPLAPSFEARLLPCFLEVFFFVSQHRPDEGLDWLGAVALSFRASLRNATAITNGLGIAARDFG